RAQEPTDLGEQDLSSQVALHHRKRRRPPRNLGWKEQNTRRPAPRRLPKTSRSRRMGSKGKRSSSRRIFLLVVSRQLRVGLRLRKTFWDCLYRLPHQETHPQGQLLSVA